MTLEDKCAQHWLVLGITDPKILKEQIKTLFQKNDHQQKVLMDLYKLVFPDWDQIESIDGHPEVNEDLWKFICRLFQEFDCLHHPVCLPGGAWMNWGFIANKELSAFEIHLNHCRVTMKTKGS